MSDYGLMKMWIKHQVSCIFYENMLTGETVTLSIDRHSLPADCANALSLPHPGGEEVLSSVQG